MRSTITRAPHRAACVGDRDAGLVDLLPPVTAASCSDTHAGYQILYLICSQQPSGNLQAHAPAERDQRELTISMKLKRAFAGMIADEWSDHAVFDQRPADFADNVAKSDLYEEIFWRAIDDLDRIAGVNLSEQGE